MRKRKLILGVLTLTAIALLLRLWGVGFGLPQEYHIDEHFYYPYAWTMGQGHLVLPDQSHGPSLYLGLLLIGQKTMQLAFFPQLSDAEFGALRDTNPWPFLLSARVISAILGALTIPIVYLLAQRFRNRTLGVIAAALMTVLFFHVRDSHFGVPDTLTTLFAASHGLAVAARLPDTAIARSAGRRPVRRARRRRKVHDRRRGSGGDRRRVVDRNGLAAASKTASQRGAGHVGRFHYRLPESTAESRHLHQRHFFPVRARGRRL